jgi:hypothetical protein
MRYYLKIVPTFLLDLYRYDQVQKAQVVIEVVHPFEYKNQLVSLVCSIHLL